MDLNSVVQGTSVNRNQPEIIGHPKKNAAPISYKILINKFRPVYFRDNNLKGQMISPWIKMMISLMTLDSTHLKF